MKHNLVDGLWKREAGILRPYFSRGILVTEQVGTVVSSNHVRNCDQAIDFSGAYSANTPNGNVACSVTNNTISDVHSWGIKFANVARHIYCGQNMVTNFGLGGITVDGPSGGLPAGQESKGTSFIIIDGNTVMNPSAEYGGDGIIGIWLGVNQAVHPGFPHSCIVTNNRVWDFTGLNKMRYGIAVVDGDRNIVAGAPYHTVKNNDIIGAWLADTAGCHPEGLCVLGGSGVQVIPNEAWTSADWNVEITDGEKMHSMTANIDNVFATKTGWHSIKYNIPFAANATGVRKARIVRQGNPIVGGGCTLQAIAGEPIEVSGNAIVWLQKGANLRVELWQNSLADLNIDRANSQFSVHRIEQMGSA